MSILQEEIGRKPDKYKRNQRFHMILSLIQKPREKFEKCSCCGFNLYKAPITAVIALYRSGMCGCAFCREFIEKLKSPNKLSAKEFGCYCNRGVEGGGKSTINHVNYNLDRIDGYHDGYGYYDSIRRNIDQEQ